MRVLKLFIFIIYLFILPVNQAIGQAISLKWKRTIQGGTNFCSLVNTTDLNGDDVEDLVVAGGNEYEAFDTGIVAINGINGDVLWIKSIETQVYGSPFFMDVDLDQIPDVIISGRNAQLWCLNGKTGEVIWEFWPNHEENPQDSGWYNFFLPIKINDIDEDHIDEILIGNGGDAAAEPSDTIRPAGNLMLLDGATGAIIQKMAMPDGKETYSTALPFQYQNETHLLFGSGGETIKGSFYHIALSDFINGDFDAVETIIEGTQKGFIAAPSFGDLNGDQIDDIIIPSMDQTTYVVDGKDLSVIESHFESGTEHYTSPVIGRFNNDSTLGFGMLSSIGTFPFYQGHSFSIKTAPKKELLRFDSGIYQLTSPNVLDIDFDGVDEILFALNYDAGFSKVDYKNQFIVLDINDDTTYNILPNREGLILFSQPLLTDLDQNNKTDFIVITNNNTSDWYDHPNYSIYCYEFDTAMHVAWKGYLGNDGQGSYIKKKSTNHVTPVHLKQNTPYPNPFTSTITLKRPSSSFRLYNLIGTEVTQLTSHSVNSRSTIIDASSLPKGIYILQIVGRKPMRLVKQ